MQREHFRFSGVWIRLYKNLLGLLTSLFTRLHAVKELLTLTENFMSRREETEPLLDKQACLQ